MMSKTKKLSIAFLWHMHQPVYQLTANSDYLMPWVRLHAVKDYLDMALWVDKFENLKLNFNLVPILLDAIIDYAEKGAHDFHSRMLIIPENELTDKDKTFILTNFFDANYQTMILPNEEYHRLYKIAQTDETNDISIFPNQAYADFTALFNLAWIDPSYIASDKRLKELVKKGKNYTTEERIEILKIQREIMKKIIPTLKKMVEDHKIEIITNH